MYRLRFIKMMLSCLLKRPLPLDAAYRKRFFSQWNIVLVLLTGKVGPPFFER